MSFFQITRIKKNQNNVFSPATSMIYIFIICFYNYYLQIQERLYLNKHTQKYVCIMINKCEIDSSNMVNHNVSYSKQRG